MARSDRTEEQGGLVDTESGIRVMFDFNPDSIQDDKSTEFAEVSIPGMSHPRIQFTNGGARTLSFTLFLHHGATDDVPNAIRTLQSWLYPEYEGERLKKAPSKLLLVFGDTWPDEQWVLSSCEINRKRFDKNLNCIFAEASIELTEYIEKSRSAEELRSSQNSSSDFDEGYYGVGYFDE